MSPSGRIAAELICIPEVMTAYNEEISKINENLMDWERINRFRIVSDDWSPATGELSASLKLKRKVVADRYAGFIGCHLQTISYDHCRSKRQEGMGKAFLQVPRILYRNDATWVCPLDKEIDSIFDPEKMSTSNMVKPLAGFCMMQSKSLSAG